MRPARAATLHADHPGGPSSRHRKGAGRQNGIVGGGEKSPLPRSRHGDVLFAYWHSPLALPSLRPWSNQETGSGCEVTVKRTALLSFMLGATETSKGPEVAPTGMVMLIDVLLQVLRSRCAIQQTRWLLARLQNQNRKSPLAADGPRGGQRRR